MGKISHWLSTQVGTSSKQCVPMVLKPGWSGKQGSLLEWQCKDLYPF
jgi:hypothetical protein